MWLPYKIKKTYDSSKGPITYGEIQIHPEKL